GKSSCHGPSDSVSEPSQRFRFNADDIFTGAVHQGSCSEGYKIRLSLRLPLVQEGNNIVRIQRTRRLPFAILLRVKKFPVRTKNGQTRNALVQRNLILFGEIVVFLAIFPDIDMHNLELLYERRNIWLFELLVKHVAVVTPVAAEYKHHSLVTLGSALHCFFDLYLRIRFRAIQRWI